MIRNPKTEGNEDLQNPDAEDRPEDEVAFREIEVDDRKFKIVSTDPYGLWHIENSSGSVPSEIDGSYTGPTEAENAIKAYMAKVKHKHSNKIAVKYTKKLMESANASSDESSSLL